MVVYVRMAPQLRDGLRSAADDAGCSLNAYALQVLAAAAGDPARFRQDAPVPPVRELERDTLGFPVHWRDRAAHSAARNDFMTAMEQEMPTNDWVALVKKHDAEDPGFFVEWQRRRDTARESG